MIFFTPPPDFASRFEVVSCFCDFEGRFLALQRAKTKPQGSTWGVPAGKIDPGEPALTAITREAKEEAGLDIVPQFFQTLYVRYDTYDFIYHIFSTELLEQPKIILNATEHQDYRWVTPEESLELPLIPDMDECIRLFYRLTPAYTSL